MNYKVGPQSGGPLYVPDVPNDKDGPQARDPVKIGRAHV